MPNILLLEDDPETGSAIRAMLEVLGHGSEWVRNGREALAHVEAHPPPDLILTDILMPDIDGLEAIQRLRMVLPLTPIIAMSGQANAPYLQAAVVYGAGATLKKPFTLRVLQETIVKVLGS